MEHLYGCGLISLSRSQEAPQLLPALVLSDTSLGGFQILSTPLRSNCCREIGKLLRLQCEELIAGLARLQGARRTLARGHKGRHLRAVRIEIPDDGGLHPHGVLKTGDRVLPAHLRVGDQRLI